MNTLTRWNPCRTVTWDSLQNTTWISLFCHLSAAALSAMLCHGQIVIDSFDTGGPFFMTGPHQFAQQFSDSILGGTRLVFPFGDADSSPQNTVSLTPADGFLEYNCQRPGGLTLEYGRLADVPMNANLTSGTKFRLNLTQAPVVAPFGIDLFVADNSNNSISSHSVLIFGNGPGVYDIPFEQFPGIQFDKIGALALELVSPTRTGEPWNGPGVYRLESFSVVVPEPRTYGVVTAAIVAIVAVGRVARRSARIMTKLKGHFRPQ